MLFAKSLLLGAFALASSVAAQSGGRIAFTITFNSVTAGQTVPVTFTGGDGTPAEISLRSGPANNLGAPTVLTSSATGGSYSWTVDKSLASGSNYALQIKQGSDVNYSGQFTIAGGSGSASVSSSISSQGAAATANASSIISSIISSVSSSVTASIAANASTTAAPTGGNGTVTSATLSSTETATETASTTTTDSSASTSAAGSGAGASSTSAPNKSGAMSLGVASPLALVLTAVAAMVYLN